MDVANKEKHRSGPSIDAGGANMPKSLGALTRLRNGFSSSGRKLMNRILPFFEREVSGQPERHVRTVCDLARALLSIRGEASGVALATDLLTWYEQLDPPARNEFFQILASDFDPDENDLTRCWDQFRKDGPQALPALAKAVEAPRQELFRRLNHAPGGTPALVRMRADLMVSKRSDPALNRVEDDLRHLLQSWFNRGFLTMQSIDWSSPASLLERLIRYESVHDINSWAELRLRLDPRDRRCFAFFHPAMPDEPLIFVEVALTSGIPENIQALLASDRMAIEDTAATTATFYSINNCQPGLAGISFGHFLIKQVAADLKRELPNLKCFVTLSPVPGLMNWLRKSAGSNAEQAMLDRLGDPDDRAVYDDPAARAFLLEKATTYFTGARNAAGKPYDPVARFHLGNGARLEQVNWRADMSPNGLRQSGGIMVNYLYDLAHLEENHEAFVDRGEVVTGAPFRNLADSFTAGRRAKGHH